MAAAGELSRLLKDSPRVRFRVRRFGADDPCGMEDFLSENVALLCIYCSGDEGEANTLYARTLSKKLHQAGKGWSQRTGKAPGCFAALGYGHMDPYVMLYRNSRGDSGLIAEALEALGSTPLLRHQYVDEKVPGGVAAVAQQWAQRVAQQVDDWARGGWSPEPEKLKGPEWTASKLRARAPSEWRFPPGLRRVRALALERRGPHGDHGARRLDAVPGDALQRKRLGTSQRTACRTFDEITRWEFVVNRNDGAEVVEGRRTSGVAAPATSLKSLLKRSLSRALAELGNAIADRRSDGEAAREVAGAGGGGKAGGSAKAVHVAADCRTEGRSAGRAAPARKLGDLPMKRTCAEASLTDLLAKAGQEHVLAYWADLSGEEQAALEAQLWALEESVGLASLKPALAETLKAHAEAKVCEIAPPPAEWVNYADGSDLVSEKRWEDAGLDLVAQGKCAACVLAGGMGTRLGSSYPKGMLGAEEIGEDFLPSRKSIFQLQAERILSVQRRAQSRAGLAEAPTVFFLVMTGAATDAPTRDFFKRHKYFGLKDEQVVFFEQGVMPCMAEDGKMLMETKGKIAVSPDGNAGIYPALRRHGVLDTLQAKGVEYVQCFSVDNILVRVADPVWYGFQKEAGADVVAKTIPKRNWQEAVGVVTLKDGAPGVIEYSEIGEVRAQETDASGSLRYNAANICLQAYTLDFLRGPAQQFKTVWHVARKDIPTVNGKTPGIKLEGFIFDVFAVAKVFRTLQVERAAEFSAIKNASASGKPDTPATALESISRLHRRWLRAAGSPIVEDDASGAGPICEVSPLVSYAGEGLADRAAAVDVSKARILVD
ncbi:unnamed protein product [Prorocentrum cordatum]|uniref:UDP-N-acetylglucosamine diphosphorylase n=1 Tax=Prorocentrum cordatum TaxID=2364126 RepID=A0ABN9WQH3_9DINO|nr:unnamed protein product [Polarella glacialis]